MGIYYSVLKIKITENAFDFTNDEIKIIYYGMDKNRYRRQPRYLDLKGILYTIERIKIKNKNSILINLQLETSGMSDPPDNQYVCTFQNENGTITTYYI